MVNQRGVAHVSLYRNQVGHKRSVACLVTEAFLPKPKLEAFDTPINLDGDRINNHIDNLTIRPRWYAVKYFQQFKVPPQGIRRPVIDTETGDIFATSWEAALRYGLLDKQIAIAVFNRTYVWPTFQMFKVVGEKGYHIA